MLMLVLVALFPAVLKALGGLVGGPREEAGGEPLVGFNVVRGLTGV